VHATGCPCKSYAYAYSRKTAYQSNLYIQVLSYFVWNHTNIQLSKNYRVFSECGFVTGSEIPCLVVKMIQCNLFYRQDYVNNQVDTQNNRQPAGWQITHTQIMNFNKSSCMQYWQLINKICRQFSIICSQDVKQV
jgi:hypothetical protein